MKHLTEYRDRYLAEELAKRIRETSRRPVRLMEICGTHTMAVFRHGLRALLPEQVELISGPGCPVCVTSMEQIDMAVELAGTPGVTVATFGDMLRVPGSQSSLSREASMGADVRVVYSSLDALRTAVNEPQREVVFLGIGFETTAPTVAAAIRTAREKGVKNFSVLSAHKLLPPAMDALASSADSAIDGFICPGHVSTVIGISFYEKVAARYGIPCVVAGFEPVDILQAVLMLLSQIEAGRAEAEIQYVRAVRPRGNPSALAVMEEVFEPCESTWRGMGRIPLSGLAIRDSYASHDAGRRFEINPPPAKEPPGCRCPEVLRGAARPVDCPLFRKQCTPRTPVGACMVSSEGACAAYFKYRIEE